MLARGRVKVFGSEKASAGKLTLIVSTDLIMYEKVQQECACNLLLPPRLYFESVGCARKDVVRSGELTKIVSPSRSRPVVPIRNSLLCKDTNRAMVAVFWIKKRLIRNMGGLGPKFLCAYGCLSPLRPPRLVKHQVATAFQASLPGTNGWPALKPPSTAQA